MDKKLRILITGGSGFIGTHFCTYLFEQKVKFINLDIKEPILDQHQEYWINCDILNPDKLIATFREFQPTHVVHLAARASMEGTSIDDFQENTTGTENVLNAIRQTPSVERVVIASSQHVRKPGSDFPKHDEDFDPHGLYGESKVITEKLTRSADLDCVWTIVRPTNVWGPGHPFLVNGLWRLMNNNLYFHPENDPVIRSYGYVKNVVWQIEQILVAPVQLIDKRTLYIGELPIKQLDWINAFSITLTGHNTFTLPKSFIQVLAWAGDFLGFMGVSFPMHSERFFNLTNSNSVPTNVTIELFGDPPYSLDDGIAETVDWLEVYWRQS